MAFTKEVIHQMLSIINIYAPIMGYRSSIVTDADKILGAIRTRCSICANFMFLMYGYSAKEEVLEEYKQGNLEEGYLYEVLNNIHYVNMFVSGGLYFVIESAWNGYPPQITIYKRSDDSLYAAIIEPGDVFHVKRYKMGVAKINIIEALKNKREQILNSPNVLEKIKDYFREDEDPYLSYRINIKCSVDVDDDGVYIPSGRS
jgi:hypothetical protein